jgi:hypothetical protein
MKSVSKRRAFVWVCCTALAGGVSQAARAADLNRPAPWEAAPPPPVVYGYGGFNPFFDPRCRIVPMPEASLYGDTARFRPTAVCQSRGVYADSVVIP